MKIYSFDSDSTNRIKRDSKQANLFNLFEKNIRYINGIPLNIYIVPREYEMRLDRISDHIYGSTDFVEELMVLNDIISPYSVKEGQYIYFCQYDNLSKLYTTDEMANDTEENRQKLIQSSQSNKNLTNKNLPLTIKPSNLEQIKVSSDNRVQIINTFE